MSTTDWELPGMDNAALDKAWTEEAVRRAKKLADDLYEATKLAGPVIRATTDELSTLLYELGLHLDCTAGYDITGG